VKDFGVATLTWNENGPQPSCGTEKNHLIPTVSEGTQAFMPSDFNLKRNTRAPFRV
jgi:hypothetical protein